MTDETDLMTDETFKNWRKRLSDPRRACTANTFVKTTYTIEASWGGPYGMGRALAKTVRCLLQQGSPSAYRGGRQLVCSRQPVAGKLLAKLEEELGSTA